MNRQKSLAVFFSATLVAVSCSRAPSDTARQAAPSATAQSAAKQAPTQAAAPQPPAEAHPPAPLSLPAGTVVKIRTTTALSTKSHKTGDTFAASLAEPLIAGGRVIAPKGAAVQGLIADSDPGGRVKGRARLAVRLSGIETAPGRMLPIQTNVYRVVARATKRQDAMKIGIGSGAGAAIGALAGGGAGAAIGAAAGAGAGTGYVLATRGEPATIRSEALLSFRLASPVMVRPEAP